MKTNDCALPGWIDRTAIGAVKAFNGIFHHRIVRAWIFLEASVLAALIGTAPLQAASRWDVLQSIHSLENPSDTSRPGRHGELGAYQFRSSTWAMHTRRPFRAALERKASDEVAILHYEWLKSRLVHAGLEPSTFNIALAWNAGLTAVIRGRAPAASWNYATRADNLATELSRR